MTDPPADTETETETETDDHPSPADVLDALDDALAALDDAASVADAAGLPVLANATRGTTATSLEVTRNRFAYAIGAEVTDTDHFAVHMALADDDPGAVSLDDYREPERRPNAQVHDPGDSDE